VAELWQRTNLSYVHARLITVYCLCFYVAVCVCLCKFCSFILFVFLSYGPRVWIKPDDDDDETLLICLRLIALFSLVDWLQPVCETWFTYNHNRVYALTAYSSRCRERRFCSDNEYLSLPGRTVIVECRDVSCTARQCLLILIPLLNRQWRSTESTFLMLTVWRLTYIPFLPCDAACAIYAVIVCPCLSVCPSVCHKSVLYKDG